MITELRLAELLCARLCHELSSPLGVILGTLPLLAQGKAESSVLPGCAAGEMASHAARDATARLRLLRAAWTGEEMARDAADLIALIRDGLGAPLTLSITETPEGKADQSRAEDVEHQRPLPPATGRLVINLALLGAQLRPRPSALTFIRQGRRLIARLPRDMAWPVLPDAGTLEEMLREAERAGDPRASQLPVTLLLAWRQGMSVVRNPDSPAEWQIDRAFPLPMRVSGPGLGQPERRRRR